MYLCQLCTKDREPRTQLVVQELGDVFGTGIVLLKVRERVQVGVVELLQNVLDGSLNPDYSSEFGVYRSTKAS